MNKNTPAALSAVRNTSLDGEVQRVVRKEHDKMHKCGGTITRIVSGEEVTQLKKLFDVVKREGPQGEVLGMVDLLKSPECAACPFRLSWGYTTYCDNGEKIEQVTTAMGDEGGSG
jgi:hypothetical protein